MVKSFLADEYAENYLSKHTANNVYLRLRELKRSLKEEEQLTPECAKEIDVIQSFVKAFMTNHVAFTLPKEHYLDEDKSYSYDPQTLSRMLDSAPRKNYGLKAQSGSGKIHVIEERDAASKKEIAGIIARRLSPYAVDGAAEMVQRAIQDTGKLLAPSQATVRR